MAFFYILARLVHLFFVSVWALMILRVALDFVMADEKHPIYRFVFLVTEPLVVPVRSLLGLIFDVETMPVDISFFIAFFILGSVVRTVGIG